jgi:hypothetical protein
MLGCEHVAVSFVLQKNLSNYSSTLATLHSQFSSSVSGKRFTTVPSAS